MLICNLKKFILRSCIMSLGIIGHLKALQATVRSCQKFIDWFIDSQFRFFRKKITVAIRNDQSYHNDSSICLFVLIYFYG